jgi:hypothetical protein
MTTSEGGDGGQPESSPARLISVVDAVCCVYFCAAGKSALLISVLAELGRPGAPAVLLATSMVEDVVTKDTIRDTQDRGTGPVLRVTQDDWTRFTSSLKR